MTETGSSAAQASVTTTHAPNAVFIGRAQLGDLRALDALLAGIQEPLYEHIRIVLGDAHAAEDVLQDTLLTISRKLKSLREPRYFRAWAYRIATRAAMRQARRARRHPEAVDANELAHVAADEGIDRFDPELTASIPRMLAQVPPASRLVLRMHYLEGLTYVEIGEALEISIGTVKSRLAYGLAAMRRIMQLDRST